MRLFFFPTFLLWIMMTVIHAAPSHKSVGVFCSADDKIPDSLKKLTFALGQKIAAQHYGLVTGGSKTGLMKEVVDGFKSGPNNGELYGILPEALKSYDVNHPLIAQDKIFWTDTIHLRLDTFIQRCDVMVILPGGWGTLHELMDFLVHRQFGLIQQKIILLNTDGYWDGLLAQFHHMVKHNALQAKHLEALKVVNSLDECLSALNDTSKQQQGLNDRYWEKNTK